MNKIDDFYKKKELLKEVKNKLKHYRFYNIFVVEGEKEVSIHLHLTDNLDHLDKQYLKGMYWRLKRMLENSDLVKNLEGMIIEELGKELENLKNEIKEDFDIEKEVSN